MHPAHTNTNCPVIGCSACLAKSDLGNSLRSRLDKFSEEKLDRIINLVREAHMGTKLDMTFANGVVEGVNALVLEVQRLERLVDELEITEQKKKLMVDWFLAWPLPATVRPDNLDADGKIRPGSTGTNLMSADEAKQMFDYLFKRFRVIESI